MLLSLRFPRNYKRGNAAVACPIRAFCAPRAGAARLYDGLARRRIGAFYCVVQGDDVTARILNSFGVHKAPVVVRAQFMPKPSSALRILSWNVLRKVGAGAEDVAALIGRYSPDLVLLQEADLGMEKLPELVGGDFARDAFPSRIHGPAIWSPTPIARPRIVRLRGGHTRRHAQIVELGAVTIVNVHLGHGQLTCRRQLREAASAIAGMGAVIGDFNMIGPAGLPGFSDVGPREPTHIAQDTLPVRIDRCLVRGMACHSARALSAGRSDHRPMLLELSAAHAALAA
jgi:endonuclease/exonuclease/phosphatase family metal-dependent hydrolase